jgi:hypothetical protein
VRFALYTCYFFAATTAMFILARIIKRNRGLRRSGQAFAQLHTIFFSDAIYQLVR